MGLRRMPYQGGSRRLQEFTMPSTVQDLPIGHFSGTETPVRSSVELWPDCLDVYYGSVQIGAAYDSAPLAFEYTLKARRRRPTSSNPTIGDWQKSGTRRPTKPS